MFLSPNTVTTEVTWIYRKIGLPSSNQAVNLSCELGLTKLNAGLAVSPHRGDAHLGGARWDQDKGQQDWRQGSGDLASERK